MPGVNKPEYKPAWHPNDDKQNFDHVLGYVSSFIPEIPTFSIDLAADESFADDAPLTDWKIECNPVTAGTLSYKWMKSSTIDGTYTAVASKTSAAYGGEWTADTDDGYYKVEVTNTLNGMTNVAYSNICHAVTEASE